MIEPDIRFYAGYPIGAHDGSKIGTLCLIDRQPRQSGDEDRDLLRDLGQRVGDESTALALATAEDLLREADERMYEQKRGG